MHTWAITRRIEIDAGHRIPAHESKCRHIHGHRYKIEATLQGNLMTQGSQEGMVMDFGFLKDLMVEEIHDLCDHHLILHHKDPLLVHLLPAVHNPEPFKVYCGVEGTEIYILDAIPTAENLAAHWFARINPRVNDIVHGQARLLKVTVHETPNSIADYL